MSELDLYKFITNNDIEWHRRENEGTEDIIIFPNTFQLDDLIKILSPGLFDDGGVECHLMNGYVCIWMKDICEYSGIDMDRVFTGEEK